MMTGCAIGDAAASPLAGPVLQRASAGPDGDRHESPAVHQARRRTARGRHCRRQAVRALSTDALKLQV